MIQKEEWQDLRLPIGVNLKFIYIDDGIEGGKISIDYSISEIEEEIKITLLKRLKEGVRNDKKRNT